jgi:hypothetical protein
MRGARAASARALSTSATKLNQRKHREVRSFPSASVGCSDAILELVLRFGNRNWGPITGLSKPLRAAHSLKPPALPGDIYSSVVDEFPMNASATSAGTIAL